jgi:hypothetical protein
MLDGSRVAGLKNWCTSELEDAMLVFDLSAIAGI